jgi:hypothetical protein
LCLHYVTCLRVCSSHRTRCVMLSCLLPYELVVLLLKLYQRNTSKSSDLSWTSTEHLDALTFVSVKDAILVFHAKLRNAPADLLLHRPSSGLLCAALPSVSCIGCLHLPFKAEQQRRPLHGKQRRRLSCWLSLAAVWAGNAAARFGASNTE